MHMGPGSQMSPELWPQLLRRCPMTINPPKVALAGSSVTQGQGEPLTCLILQSCYRAGHLGTPRKDCLWVKPVQLFPLPQTQVSSLTPQWALLFARAPPCLPLTHSQDYVAVTIEEAAKGAKRNRHHLHSLEREGKSKGTTQDSHFHP